MRAPSEGLPRKPARRKLDIGLPAAVGVVAEAPLAVRTSDEDENDENDNVDDDDGDDDDQDDEEDSVQFSQSIMRRVHVHTPPATPRNATPRPQVRPPQLQFCSVVTDHRKKRPRIARRDEPLLDVGSGDGNDNNNDHDNNDNNNNDGGAYDGGDGDRDYGDDDNGDGELYENDDEDDDFDDVDGRARAKQDASAGARGAAAVTHRAEKERLFAAQRLQYDWWHRWA